jgi:hypothetical protein
LPEFFRNRRVDFASAQIVRPWKMRLMSISALSLKRKSPGCYSPGLFLVLKMRTNRTFRTT